MKELVIFENQGEVVLLQSVMYVGREGLMLRDKVYMETNKQTNKQKPERAYVRLCNPCHKI